MNLFLEAELHTAGIVKFWFIISYLSILKPLITIDDIWQTIEMQDIGLNHFLYNKLNATDISSNKIIESRFHKQRKLRQSA